VAVRLRFRASHSHSRAFNRFRWALKPTGYELPPPHVPLSLPASGCLQLGPPKEAPACRYADQKHQPQAHSKTSRLSNLRRGLHCLSVKLNMPFATAKTGHLHPPTHGNTRGEVTLVAALDSANAHNGTFSSSVTEDVAHHNLRGCRCGHSTPHLPLHPRSPSLSAHHHLSQSGTFAYPRSSRSPRRRDLLGGDVTFGSIPSPCADIN
jgi:hypothetical protein